MKVYNTLTKSKQEFIPLDKQNVKMYACGVTVYDSCHIGHARQAITYDMIYKYLKYKGYKVKYARNYTDVDDKIIARANKEGINPLIYSQTKIIEAEQDLSRLGVGEPDIKPKASENIENIINFIQELIEKKHAYSTEKGDVYYSVKSFKEYGKLSKRNTDELLNGVRKEVEEGKKEPLDFALWKSAKPGEISWKSPWGEGRPGWHIECSAMSLNNLGECLDIHGGGKDLIFPHHENEIAQSEGRSEKQFAKYWIHNGLIKVNGQKMSKSLGNTLTIKSALDKYEPEVIKYTMFSKHYSSDVDLTEKEFAIAEKQMYYFYTSLKAIEDIAKKTTEELEEKISDKIEQKFSEAMDDDFNTSVAIAELFSIFKFTNTLIKNNKINENAKANELYKIAEKIKELYKIIGILQEDPTRFITSLKQKHLSGIEEKDINELIEQRNTAKQNKDYIRADEIRKELDEKGIILNDTKEGTTWDIKELYQAQ